jgi:hypothetical protein
MMKFINDNISKVICETEEEEKGAAFCYTISCINLSMRKIKSMDRAIGKPWLAITSDNVLTFINSLLS